MVPRRRYEMLIEIYSCNMADVCSKEVYRQLKEFKEVPQEQDRIDQDYKAEYSCIVQSGDLQL